MKNINYPQAQNCIEKSIFTDKPMVIPIPSTTKKTLIGFDALLIDTDSELNQKLHQICGDMFEIQVQKQGDQTKVKIKAHKYIIENGGVFYKSILSVLKDFINEGIYFYSVQNTYSK